MPLCAYVGWRSENQRLLPLPLFTLAFKFSESTSDIQLPTPLSFITQFATGEGCVSAPCIHLVCGTANGIFKRIHLQTWISDHIPSSPQRATFSAQLGLQQRMYDATWKDSFCLHEQYH